MLPLTIRQQTEQLLLKHFESGRWGETLPGVRELSRELQVSIGTMQAALKNLESSGLIQTTGHRINRKINKTILNTIKNKKLRIGFIPLDNLDRSASQELAWFNDFSLHIGAAGHSCFFSKKSITSLGENPDLILNETTKDHADLWVLMSASNLILKEIHTRAKTPLLAWGGAPGNLPISVIGVDFEPALRGAIRRLTNDGHNRIVLVMPSYIISQKSGRILTAFRDELSQAGIHAGNYHIPKWEYSESGFNELLKSLFSLTPPSALILDDARQFIATLSFFASNGISLKSCKVMMLSGDSTYDWCHPRPGRFIYNESKLIQGLVRWVNNCSGGNLKPLRCIVRAKCVFGDTIIAK